MEKKEKIRALVALMIQRRQSFKQKLALLLLQWQNSMQLITGLVGMQMNMMQRLVAIISHSTLIERRFAKFDRYGNFWRYDVFKMDNKTFKDNFRVSKTSFKKICAKANIMAKQDTNVSPSIPIEKRVAIALYVLGSTDEYKTVSQLFGVRISTVSKILQEFCHIVSENFKSYISSYPPSPEEIKRIVEGFKELGFPQCYGALDGCHIEIRPGKEEAVDYYNENGWYSTILLAACDHRCKFTYINIGTAGKKSDSYIFERSSLKKCHDADKLFIENSEIISNVNVPVLLIGDSAFRLSRFMMKPYPFRTKQPRKEEVFNNRLRKCHQVIENSFAQLKARFQRIGKGLPQQNCNVIIRACCFLHNFLKNDEDEVPCSWLEEAQAQTRRIQPISTTIIDVNDDGKTIRDAIATCFENTVNNFKKEKSLANDLPDVGVEN